MLAALHAEAFEPTERWSPAAIALMLEAEGGFGILALAPSPVEPHWPEAAAGGAATDAMEEPLGFALARAIAGEAEVLTLGVRPGARRVGVGRALLDALKQGALERGAAVLFLEVAESNMAARAVYGAAGAKLQGRRRRYYANGEDALVLRLTLFSG